MWKWHQRREDKCLSGRTFSSVVPLGFAEPQKAGRAGGAGTDSSRVSLGKLPSAAQCLRFLTWNKGGVLTFLSCLANALDSDLLFAIKSWVLKQSTRRVWTCYLHPLEQRAEHNCNLRTLPRDWP